MALTYYDMKPFAMLTTAHHEIANVTYTRPRVRFNAQTGQTGLAQTVDVEITKLNAVHDHNCFVDGVDVADQL